MTYQFICWRTFGLNRQMYFVDVEALFKRLREANGGELPFTLPHWDFIVIFASEAKISLPENRRVAETTEATLLYPSLEWLRAEYEKMIHQLNEYIPGGQELLKNPPFKRPEIPIVNIPITKPTTAHSEVTVHPPTDDKPNPSVITPPTTEKFDTIVEGSVSNTDDKQCLEPTPATVSPTSTLTGSPNSLSMGKKSKTLR